MNTHDPKLSSWVAYDSTSSFPIQNLPLGIFSSPKHSAPRLCTAIGDNILDLAALSDASLLDDLSFASKQVFHESTLNKLIALGRPALTELRQKLSHLLASDTAVLRDNASLVSEALIPQSEVTLHLPVNIGDYTDFYSSREHATNCGIMFRGKENALMPNWLHLPVAYHGRASSVVPSGTPVKRPMGQVRPDEAAPPVFAASRLVDFELEMGFFIGKPSEAPVSVEEAEEHIAGLVLVNDWSARDIQKWEYQPLGPFLAKNFATSISPWLITLDALEPFRCESPAQDPAPLPYLTRTSPGAFAIQLEASIQTEAMDAPHTICTTNFNYLYWDMRQQLAHHTITGCNMRSGDLLASGTISGATPGSFGSMLELSWRGSKPLELPSGEERKFLQDGDTLTITGFCQGDGYRIGFGEVSGKVLPAEQPAHTLESELVSP